MVATIMANITSSDLQVWLDAPPSYEELFGTPGAESEGHRRSDVGSELEDFSYLEDTEYDREMRRQEEEEARRLSNNQNRYMVTDTRPKPPEAPHFLNPDLRPWMRHRTDGVSGVQQGESGTGTRTGVWSERTATLPAGLGLGRLPAGLRYPKSTSHRTTTNSGFGENAVRSVAGRTNGNSSRGASSGNATRFNNESTAGLSTGRTASVTTGRTITTGSESSCRTGSSTCNIPGGYRSGMQQWVDPYAAEMALYPSRSRSRSRVTQRSMRPNANECIVN